MTRPTIKTMVAGLLFAFSDSPSQKLPKLKD